MARRYYSSTAARTTLATGVDDTTTTLSVTAVSGWPSSFPYTLVIDQDTVNEELVSVTNRSGTTLTVTRGIDGTSAVAHDAGAAVNHGVSAQDFDEPNEHVNDSTTDVHSQYLLKSVADAKGDILVASGSDAWTRLPVGASGQVLMADPAATNGLSWVENSPNRNLLYNGAMQVAQRGTSTASITTSGYYTADRWYEYINGMGTWTNSVEADGPTGSGFTKSLKMLCTTADASPAVADALAVFQMLEGQDLQRVAKGTAGAQELTMSFWVKSNVTGTFTVQLSDYDNGRGVSAQYTVDASATWEYKTVTFPADTSGPWDNDNGASVSVRWWLGVGSNYTSGTLQTAWGTEVGTDIAPGQTNLAAATNNYWQVTGVQLEVGPTATPFEFKSYGQELRECQRYCYVWASSSGNVYKQMTPMATDTANRGAGLVQFPTTMRGAPTAAFSAASDFLVQKNGGTTYAGTAASIANTDVDGTRVLISVASGIAIGDNTTQLANNTANARITLSAEL